MDKASSFSDFINEQNVQAPASDANTRLGQAQDRINQIMQDIQKARNDMESIGGSGINQVGVQSNIKKTRLAQSYRDLADALTDEADAEFAKAKEDEQMQRAKQQQLDRQEQLRLKQERGA